MPSFDDEFEEFARTLQQLSEEWEAEEALCALTRPERRLLRPARNPEEPEINPRLRSAWSPRASMSGAARCRARG